MGALANEHEDEDGHGGECTQGREEGAKAQAAGLDGATHIEGLVHGDLPQIGK